MGKFEGLKMAKMTDWSREREGWWIGVGMGKKEGRKGGKRNEKGVVKYGENGSD